MAIYTGKARTHHQWHHVKHETQHARVGISAAAGGVSLLVMDFLGLRPHCVCKAPI